MHSVMNTHDAARATSANGGGTRQKRRGGHVVDNLADASRLRMRKTAQFAGERAVQSPPRRRTASCAATHNHPSRAPGAGASGCASCARAARPVRRMRATGSTTAWSTARSAPSDAALVRACRRKRETSPGTPRLAVEVSRRTIVTSHLRVMCTTRCVARSRAGVVATRVKERPSSARSRARGKERRAAPRPGAARWALVVCKWTADSEPKDLSGAPRGWSRYSSERRRRREHLDFSSQLLQALQTRPRARSLLPCTTPTTRRSHAACAGSAAARPNHPASHPNWSPRRSPATPENKIDRLIVLLDASLLCNRAAVAQLTA